MNGQRENLRTFPLIVCSSSSLRRKGDQRKTLEKKEVALDHSCHIQRSDACSKDKGPNASYYHD